MSRRLFALLLLLALGGCATPPSRVTAPGVDPVATLLAHPEARAVAQAYPDFFRAALNSVAELKHDLALEANR